MLLIVGIEILEASKYVNLERLMPIDFLKVA